MKKFISNYAIQDNINLFDGFFLGGSLGACFGVVFDKMITFVIVGLLIGISTQLICTNEHILKKKFIK